MLKVECYGIFWLNKTQKLQLIFKNLLCKITDGERKGPGRKMCRVPQEGKKVHLQTPGDHKDLEEYWGGWNSQNCKGKGATHGTMECLGNFYTS